MIEMTLIGTGATMPLPERAVTAATLNCGGHTILFDCGEGTQAAARKAKDWAKADALRDELAALGWAVEDTAAGPKLVKKD